MSGPNQSRTGVEPQERRLRESWWLFAVSFLVLAVIVLLRLIAEGARPDNAALAVLVVVVGFAAILHRNRVLQLQVGRRAEAESLARILQGLSRSVSPDAIVAAIVEEVGIGAGADHVVVVRRRSEGDGLEATLVSSRPGVPSSTTLFPLSDLEDPHSGGSWVRDPIPIRVAPDPVLEAIPAAVASAAAACIDRPAASPSRPVTRLRPASARHLRQDWLATGGRVRRQLGRLESVLTRGQGLSIVDAGIGRPEDGALDGAAVRIAARIADRARSAYGLRNTLSEPLRTDDGVIGAIVLSRRVADPWPASARRVLAGAAMEASAALARANHHREAETRATTDALTGLPNRRYFDEFCGLLARRRRADDAVGLLLIDIDWFKSVNDTWGHSAGDQVLREVAGAIVGAVREDDVPARFGGEEFAVLLRNPGGDVAVDVAERVRAAVARLDLRRFGPSGVTVSVGAAVATGPDQPISELIAAADGALYDAKRDGRDRVVAAA